MTHKHQTVLTELSNGRGLFILQHHRDAAWYILAELRSMTRQRDDLAAAKKQDEEKITALYAKIESSEQSRRETERVRRNLEKRTTDLELELAETQTQHQLRERIGALESKIDRVRDDSRNITRDRNDILIERNEVAGERDKFRSESEKLRNELDLARRELKRTFELLSAVVLNAKQIQIIVEQGLTPIRDESVAVGDIGPASAWTNDVDDEDDDIAWYDPSEDRSR